MAGTAAKLTDSSKKANDSNELLGKLESMEVALEGVSTGYGSSLNIAGAMVPGGKSPVDVYAERQTIDALTTDIQLTFTARTKGAISEAEMALFRDASPGLSKEAAANKSLISAMKAVSLRSLERDKFLNTWADAHEYSLSGADAAWKKYTDNNELIVKSGGQLAIVQANLGNWQSYITGEPVPINKDIPQMNKEQLQNLDPSKLSSEELKQAADRWGSLK